MISRAVKLADLQNNYNWNKYDFILTNKEDLKEFLKSKNTIVGTDKNFNVPLYINPIGTDCILIYKDGSKLLSEYNETNKGFYFKVNNEIKTISQLKTKVSKIIFFDNFMYHEIFRKYWSENGFKCEGYKHKNTLLNDLLKEF